MSRLKQLLEAFYNLPFALGDKWLSEAGLATQQTIALEMMNEETRRQNIAASASCAERLRAVQKGSRR